METSTVAHAYIVGLLGLMKLTSHKEKKKEQVEREELPRLKKKWQEWHVTTPFMFIHTIHHQQLIQYTPKSFDC